MQPRAAVRLARALWIAWAIIVWNVVFDHVIVVAGREYIHAAGLAAGRRGPDGRSLVLMDDWMRPAVTRGAWMASAAAAVILLTGFLAIRFATNRSTARSVERVERGLTPGLTPREDSR